MEEVLLVLSFWVTDREDSEKSAELKTQDT